MVRTGFAIHLMEPHLSKGTGLEVMFEKMGWSPEDLLCVCLLYTSDAADE